MMNQKILEQKKSLMEKTSTRKKSSNYYLGLNGIRDSENSTCHDINGFDVMEPNPSVVRNILSYARALEVLKPNNQMVFYFIKN